MDMTLARAQRAVRRSARSLTRPWRPAASNGAEPDRRMAQWADVRRRQAMADPAQCLERLLGPNRGITPAMVQELFDEVAACDPLRRSVERYKDVIGKDFQAKLSGVVVAAILFNYVATRIVRPEVVVETGCATGWTSALFLLALRHNGKGHLYTIDLPAVSGELSMDWTLPAGLETGFLAPEELRDRWTLIIGDARAELMPLLAKVQQVDIFYHDSDHTYQHMMWEYTSVWPHLPPGGLLVSDDIGWNTAAWDFSRAMSRPLAIHGSNLNFGALAKAVGPSPAA
ncbi:MAG: class I SAM-dependent methyltransferase [Chloroflexi bacterium]|nr:class I SAM-dependent methyltransferase [Chloroflexota bacterium]